MIKTGFTDATIDINQIIHTHSIPDRKLHTARRKVLNHAFSETALRNIEPQVTQKIREWCTIISEPETKYSDNALEKGNAQWSQKRDMGRWSGYLTTDVLAQVCFSQQIGASKNAGSVWDDTIPGTMGMISKVSSGRHRLECLLQVISLTESFVTGLLSSNSSPPLSLLVKG